MMKLLAPNAFGLFVVLAGFAIIPALAQGAEGDSCPQGLWPRADLQSILAREDALRSQLLHTADKALDKDAAPVARIHSAGVRDKSDPDLQRSRRAFRDADYAAVLALAYALTGKDTYLEHTRNLLRTWARVNEPTGHPIDETRLEGLVWAYVITCESLGRPERRLITNYFHRMYTAKQAWRFGPKTAYNNHMTHHLKMQLLLARALNQSEALADNARKAREHLSYNIDPRSGVSRDYRERDALFYHVYNLEAWLEIQLLTDCCEQAIASALQFAGSKILGGDTGGEFAASTAAIDRARGVAGFDYAKAEGNYDVKRAGRTLVVWSTLDNKAVPQDLWNKVDPDLRDQRLLFFRVRQLIWTSP